MSMLRVSFAPVSSAEIPANAGPFFVDAVYTRSVEEQTTKELADLPKTVQETVRGTLDGRLNGSMELADVARASPIDLNFLSGNGALRLRKTVSRQGEDAIAVELSTAEVSAITAPDPQPAAAPPQTTRRAYFVPVDQQRVPFETSKLQIAPLRTAQGGWSSLGLGEMFHSDSPATTAVQWNPALLAQMPAVQWTPVHVAIDGQFGFTVPAGSGDAWLWWLSGPMPAIGVVLDDLGVPRVARIAVALPPFPAGAPADGGPTRVPTDVTETEVVNNPLVYTEDPGEFCKPFKNPERVLGERSFFVIFRVEQPVISAEASVRKDPLPVLTSVLATTARDALEIAPAAPTTTARTSRTAAAAARAGAAAPARGNIAPGTLIAGDTEAAFLRHALPGAYLDVLRSYDRGRTEMDAAHPVQWEGDSSRYQATTVARGHILEFRMRWRSNGYSLGTVAKTLTLAPRQARRIEKVEWSRTEIARRQESTRLLDQVSDTLTRDRDYDDSVQANLSEWARGESSSNMVAGAAGGGFCIPPFVVGGGGGASHASSSSSQEGGRNTSASEEQRLRDSIRRYGDSLRKLDSLVVNEVTQEETATGTTEVVRNLNYGHSLTVIYYQILRHLKIETGVAGVRECLFVPFAITPFTAVRAYRWREAIRKRLRDPQYAEAIRYLRDVVTQFATSSIPAGPRSKQPVRFIRGSIFVNLAVDRPRDKDDGFDAATWALVQPFLGVPALGIFQALRANDEAQRDALFQKQHAGRIAAGWANTLELKASGTSLPADFTLATRYQFNSAARIDFNVRVPAGVNVTREMLSALHFTAGKPLPPGSVANLQSVSFTYQTDHFQRTVSADLGTDDLIDVETGAIDGNGASAAAMPDEWEQRDVRAEMQIAVQGLVEHLNEHVEYYSKAVWWDMDRDRLFMLIDGFYIPGTNQVSIASVVEREPIAIIGNAIVFRVSAGSFLGLGTMKTPADLLNYYIGHDAPSEPMLISLPTDGLYAQTVMDECAALEEHFGNTDWVLNDPDPTLSEISPELLASRRAEPQATTPTTLPPTLINLQNAPEAPAPAGLAGALAAVTTPNAFRDMAGLAGTQANAAAAFQTAASLAQNFGNQAAALKLAEIAKDAHATQTADQKLATVQRALDKGLTTPEEAQRQSSQIMDQMHGGSSASPQTQHAAAITDVTREATKPGVPFSVTHSDGDGTTTIERKPGAAGDAAGDATDQPQDQGVFQLVPDPLGWAEAHGADLPNDKVFDLTSSTRPQEAFEEGEHLEAGASMTDTVDAWAMAGLIEGGAMIDTHIGGGKIAPEVDKWDIYLPQEGPTDTPNAPYDSIPSIPTPHAHWHYILPDPVYQDPINKVRWTKESLRQALKQGEAAVLNFGQLVFIGGDWVGSFQDLHQPFLYKQPVNVMQSVDKLVPLAFVMMDVLQNGGAEYFDLKDLDKAATGKLSSSSVNPNVHMLLEAFEQVRSAPFGPIQLLGQIMASGQMPLDWNVLERHATWLKTGQLAIQELRNLHVAERLLQILITNGWFLELAASNRKHFTPDNWTAFEADYTQALDALQAHLAKQYPGPAIAPAPIPASVLAQVAFSLHYLTDAFSAAHMRVPRPALGTNGAIAAKVMHDIDGKMGLVVSDSFGDKWKAYGDGYLHGPTADDIKALHQQYVAKGNGDPSVDANYEHVRASVGEAVLLSHYEAQRHRVDGNAASFPILDKARGTGGTPGIFDYLGDKTAPRTIYFPTGDVWLQKTRADMIAHMRKHQPVPVGTSTDASGNPPPLYDPLLIIDRSGTYWHKTKSAGYEHIVQIRFASKTYELDVSQLYHLARIRKNTELPGVPLETFLPVLLGDGGLKKP
jgi:hypothetical protein